MRSSFRVGAAYGALKRFRHYPKILVEGPRGTAKSRSILSFLVGQLFEHPGARLLICRRYRAELTKTILTTLEEEVFPSLGMAVSGGAHRNNRSEYRLPNGSLIWPAGIDDGMGVLSMGITYVYCAEVIEMEEETVTDISGGMRWLKCPERPDLPETSLMIMDTNPGAPAHWSNRRAEPATDQLRYVKTRADYHKLQAFNHRPAEDPVKRWKRVITKHQDNPGYWDHDAWDYTPLGRSYITQQLEGLAGYKRERWLNGLWKAAEGNVFPEFDPNCPGRHVMTPFPIPADWPIYVWWDPGYDHPTAILWFAVGYNGRIYVIDEIYRGGLGVGAHCEAIHAHNAGRTVTKYFADPQHAFSETAQSPKSIATQAKEHGITLIRGPRSTDVEGQVEALRDLLIKGMFAVFSTCTNTIDEFCSWRYKRNAQGLPLAGDDAFEDSSNHAIDGCRGVVAAGIGRGKRTVTVL